MDHERFGGRRPFGGERPEGRERFGGWHEESEQRAGWDRGRDRKDWGPSPEREREPGREEERGKRRERSTRWDKDDRLDKLEPNGLETVRDSAEPANELPDAKDAVSATPKEENAEVEQRSKPVEEKKDES